MEKGRKYYYKDQEMHNCTGIQGKQWFLQDIPSVARIVGR